MKMTKKNIVLVEKEADGPEGTEKVFSRAGHHVRTVADGARALETILGNPCDLVIVELDLPGMNGLELLKRVKEMRPALPVILISGHATVGDAVKAMKLGAADFLLKPLTPEMAEMISRATGRAATSPDRVSPEEPHAIITKNEEMQRLLKRARDVADSRASIFIQGESGTGKELFARYIHRFSDRRERPFVAINCAALPETLLESELFGHEKGSFTGALSRKRGKFEIADRGTILLDEISEMDYQLQSKLLRVLQEKEIDRLGGTRPRPVDVRVIATTNRNIEDYLEKGKFREDLYYRLNVVPFHLPPLRERREDIPLLAEHFIEKFNRQDKRNVKGMTEGAMMALLRMPWKGNVRELENVIERSVLMCRGDRIDEECLFMFQREKVSCDESFPFLPAVSLKEMEKNVIFRALDQTNGNRTHAAEILGISVRTLRNKLKEYRERLEAQEREGMRMVSVAGGT